MKKICSDCKKLKHSTSSDSGVCGRMKTFRRASSDACNHFEEKDNAVNKEKI